MKFSYIINKRTAGANAFAIFESLNKLDQVGLWRAINKMAYADFLQTAYWFAVSTVAKSRAGMRCQVCNQPKGIQVHHRTYDTHGKEHAHMEDLVVLCENCHGLFHGHKTFVPPPVLMVQATPIMMAERPRIRRHKTLRIVAHGDADLQMPDGDEIVLTRELVNKCRANGSFTNATLRAFGLTKSTCLKGWTYRLIGKRMTRDEYRKALEGRFIYNSGRLES